MKSQVPLAKQLPSPLNKPNPNALNAFKPLPPTNPQLKQTSTNTAINPKLASAPYPKQIANPPIKPTISSNLAYFDKNLKRIER